MLSPDSAPASAPASGRSESASPASSVLSLVGITKRFGQKTVLEDVSLEVRSGEVHCLLGENGAGKSTLCNIVFGVHRADEGVVELGGERFEPEGPAHALRSGVAMVHQHFSLVGNMTALENLMLGRARGRLDPRAIEARVAPLAEQFGLATPLHKPIEDLSVGERQRIEILKCLLEKPRLLVLDEPTAVLPPREVAGLLEICRRVAGEGCGVVLVTHKLTEIGAVAHRTTVLRRGLVVETVAMAGADLGALVRAMVGREVRSLDAAPGATAHAAREDRSRAIRGDHAVDRPRAVRDDHSADHPEAIRGDHAVDRPDADPDDRAEDRPRAIRDDHSADRPRADRDDRGLRLEGLTWKNEAGVARLDVTLSIRSGEIVGVAGVEGNGQRELGDILAGLLPPSAGRVLLNGEDVTGLPPRELTRRGIGIVPEDRHRVGCHVDLSVAENLWLGQASRFTRFGLLQRDRMRREAQERLATFDVRGGPDDRFGDLSGGNQQKVVLARELALEPLAFLLAAQPTRGLDVGAVEAVYGHIRRARDRGAAVLLVSSELEELLSVADRVVVLYRGRVVGEVPAGRGQIERVGALMSGHALEEGVAA